MTSTFTPRPLPASLTGKAIYQLFLRPFTAEGTLNAATKLLPHVAGLGVGIVYLCPVVEADDDPREEFWSTRQKASGFHNPKNPYRMKDFYKIDPDCGTDADLKEFVRTAHRLGLKVILDLVYLHCGPAAVILKEHPDWIKKMNGPWGFPTLNYDVSDLREHLWRNMEYFVREFDVDGYRCDVGDQIPLDFWEEGRRRIDRLKSGLFMLCESSGCPAEQTYAFEAAYGFTHAYRLGEVLRGSLSAAGYRASFAERDAILQGARILRAFDNHDITNDSDPRFDRAVSGERVDAALTLCFSLNGVPFLYNGQEIADYAPHSIFSDRNHGGWKIDWSMALTEKGKRRMALIQRLTALRVAHPALAEGSLEWLPETGNDDVLTFVRQTAGETVFCAFNLGTKPAAVNSDWPLDVAPEHAKMLFSAQAAAPATAADDPKKITLTLLPGGCLILW